MDALTFVYACLETVDTPLRQIARDSGVGERWLYEFAKGRVPEPGYSKVMLLADYFHRVGHTPRLREAEPQQHAFAPRRGQMNG